MGYLAVLAGSFLVTLVGVAVVLAALEKFLIGSVPEWVLMASLVCAFCASWAATHWYEDVWCAPRFGSRR
jgi:hypothetical protein